MPDLKTLYLFKEECIEKYKYHKAIDYIHVELKNVLRSDICQLIAYGIGTREEITEMVQRELQDPVYERIVKPHDHPEFYNNVFIKALVTKDVDAMYDICQERVRKERPKRILKRIVSWLMQ